MSLSIPPSPLPVQSHMSAPPQTAVPTQSQPGTVPQPVVPPDSQPVDQNQVNAQFQGPPPGDAGQVAANPQQVSFVEQQMSSSQQQGAPAEEKPGTFAQIGMLLGLAVAGAVGSPPSQCYGAVLSRVSPDSFMEQNLNRPAQTPRPVDTRVRSEAADQPAEPQAPTMPAAAPQPNPAARPEPLSQAEPDAE